MVTVLKAFINIYIAYISLCKHVRLEIYLWPGYSNSSGQSEQVRVYNILLLCNYYLQVKRKCTFCLCLRYSSVFLVCHRESASSSSIAIKSLLQRCFSIAIEWGGSAPRSSCDVNECEWDKKMCNLYQCISFAWGTAGKFIYKLTLTVCTRVIATNDVILI